MKRMVDDLQPAMADLPTLDRLPFVLDQSHLNGMHGSNREKSRRCQINAANDYEAIQCWLNEYQSKSTTYRAYQKEAERFLLWSIFQCKKPLSSIEREDFENYLSFLDDPQPSHLWCGKIKGHRSTRGKKEWRPFVGSLSPSAKMTAISILDSLFSYLVDACYLTFNPLSLMRKRQLRNRQFQQGAMRIDDRMLTIEEWQALLHTLEHLAEQTENERREKARLTFIIHLFYFLGLRVSELTSHSWNAFRKIDGLWWFYVLGKGDKIGRIPVNDELLRAVIHYRTFLKKHPLPQAQENSPLIASFTTGKAITPRQINLLLKKLALETVKKFKSNSEQAKKLKKFSAHWLRHLSASMQDRAGIAFKHIRANHRHENDETTRRYVHAIEKERHEDMQKLSLKF